MNKKTYTALRQAINRRITEMIEDGGKVAIWPMNITLTVDRKRVHLTADEVRQAWPLIVRDLRLVDDGLGSWTIPGNQFSEKDVSDALNEYLKVNQRG